MKHLLIMTHALLIASLAQADTFCGSGSSAIPDGTGNSAEWTIEVTADGIVTDARFFTQISPSLLCHNDWLLLPLTTCDYFPPTDVFR